MIETITDCGDQFTKEEIMKECEKEISELFNTAIDVSGIIWYRDNCTLCDAILMKLEEILDGLEKCVQCGKLCIKNPLYPEATQIKTTIGCFCNMGCIRTYGAENQIMIKDIMQ